jgi:hypothetical protein
VSASVAGATVLEGVAARVECTEAIFDKRDSLITVFFFAQFLLLVRMLEVAKTHAQPIFQLTRRYLDTYFFSIAEVLLEQNVDPG